MSKLNEVLFTVAGTANWTPPPGVTQVLVRAIGGGGGGGGGGGSGADNGGSGAGGAGGLRGEQWFKVQPGIACLILVGGGGSGGSAGLSDGNGGSGGTGGLTKFYPSLPGTFTLTGPGSSATVTTSVNFYALGSLVAGDSIVFASEPFSGYTVLTAPTVGSQHTFTLTTDYGGSNVTTTANLEVILATENQGGGGGPAGNAIGAAYTVGGVPGVPYSPLAYVTTEPLLFLPPNFGGYGSNVTMTSFASQTGGNSAYAVGGTVGTASGTIQGGGGGGAPQWSGGSAGNGGNAGVAGHPGTYGGGGGGGGGVGISNMAGFAGGAGGDGVLEILWWD